MINRARLLADLQAQVTQVEADLHAQLGVLPEVEKRLRAEHKGAFDAKRTAASAAEWIGERVTQAAVAWVLASVHRGSSTCFPGRREGTPTWQYATTYT
ncbi:hypothetical protein M2271_007179 [Streptomyces sp. LBL]|uniref:hypothetical protein n=1 Tax=Streptomyces sp. LBL TaxID=2940562 RepID=UPI002476A5C6|nr:hypothetical protein [Streptomyces sp. LBL]MDH6629343.1 hypothetical protein [Streptomyces sp. LBL]